jgi:hypothetical protein
MSELYFGVILDRVEAAQFVLAELKGLPGMVEFVERCRLEQSRDAQPAPGEAV